jgi:hypothetical protein
MHPLWMITPLGDVILFVASRVRATPDEGITDLAVTTLGGNDIAIAHTKSRVDGAAFCGTQEHILELQAKITEHIARQSKEVLDLRK